MSRVANNKHGQRLWNCRCDCGKEKTVLSSSLNGGDAKSCGCLQPEVAALRVKNLEGKVFGRLLVVARQGSDCRNKALWRCACSCGALMITDSSRLTRRHTKSCGCLRRETSQKLNQGEKNHFWKGGVSKEHDLIRNSAEYKNWRTAVFVRDERKCVLCGNSGEINAHHIKAFASFPELRFEISNGQTLCIPCHKKTPTYFNPYAKTS